MKRFGMILIILLFVMGCSNKNKQDDQLNNQPQENKTEESTIVNKNVCGKFDFITITTQTQKYL